jgi:5-methylcytosine-specific restriction endonuclease McrA
LGTRGVNSPVYRGKKAVSKLRKRIRELAEYKEWHSLILERDNYLCVICNTRGSGLDVDHIIKFEKIILEQDIWTTEKAKTIPILWDTLNGRTLCKECHRKTDTYGRKI